MSTYLCRYQGLTLPLLPRSITTLAYSEAMVLLTLTSNAKAAIEYCDGLRNSGKVDDDDFDRLLDRLSALATGSPVEHEDLIRLSTCLSSRAHKNGENDRQWRLDNLLKGASVYQPPPPAKTEPVRRL